MSTFDFIATPLAGLMVVQRKVTEDRRGCFSRVYCQEEFRQAGIGNNISQINQTVTYEQGAVRGLHFQYPPHAECKLVSCLKGEIWDVAIDIRRDSPTFLHWHGEVLSEFNRKSLFIPEGFAHGFQALSCDCELFYLHTAAYCREAEGVLNATDPKLNILWPLPITEISDRDRTSLFIDQSFQGVVL